MCVCKRGKKVLPLFFALVCVFLINCGPMDSLFNSSGNYKINIQVNNIPLDECSFVRSSDRIRPYFESSVSKDPDVTALMVYLKDQTGQIAGWKVIYQPDEKAEPEAMPENGEELIENEENPVDKIHSDETDIEPKNEPDNKNETEIGENPSISEPAAGPHKGDGLRPADGGVSSEEILRRDDVFQIPDSYKNGDELIIPVKNLDYLPLFPIPDNLPMGIYTINFYVMNNNDILQKVEKSFYYLSQANFSYKGINVYLPGIAESNQLIPRGTVIMLEADLKYDAKLDPYIVWYNGKKKIAEGKVSDGFGNLFWKVPEESGFYSMSAVIYPVENLFNFSGYQKDISLLISSKTIDIHLVNEDVPFKRDSQLINWYVFESNLNDSRKLSLMEQVEAEKIKAERSLKHSKNSPEWKVSDGTYGIAAGNDNIISMPKVSISNKEQESWQLLFRFKPENDGGIISVQTGKNNDVFLHLNTEGSNVTLTLTSPAGTVTQVYNIKRSLSEEVSVISVSQPPASDLPEILIAEEAEKSDETDSLELAAEPLSQQFQLQQFQLQQLVEQLNEQSREISIAAEETAEQITPLVETTWISEGSFITAGIIFTIQPGYIAAKLNILGDSVNSEIIGKPIFLETEMKNEFRIMMGYLPGNKKNTDSKNNTVSEETQTESAPVRHNFTALWDELALYRIKGIEAVSVKSNLSDNEQTAAANTAENENPGPNL